MDEFKLIQYIKKTFSSKFIGDDTAFINNSQINLISKDILIEDIHFVIKNNLFEIGAKSLISNLSDILASGGKPLFFFLGLGIPSYLNDFQIKSLLDGLKKISQKYNVKLAGGDISSAPKLFISITITGSTIKKIPVNRCGAESGDNIFVTGNLGDSEIGLRIILNQLTITCAKVKEYFIKKHYFARLYPDFVKTLCLKSKINSMIDISDGFLQDLSHILDCSKKSAEISAKAIPKSENFKKLKKVLKNDYLKIPLFSGEEYQLIFTTPESLEKIKKISKKFKVKISKVGVITEKRNEKIKILDMFEKMENLGYRHFS